MGLEAVELVLQIEETFGIQVPDEDASRMRTVGDVYQFIQKAKSNDVSKPKTTRLERCMSASVFYSLRRALIDETNEERRQIRPATKVDFLIPKEIRRRKWSELSDRLQLKLPSLGRPRWLTFSLFLACFALFAACLGLVHGWTDDIRLTIEYSLIALPIFACVFLLDTPFHTTILPYFADFGGLTKAIISLNLEAILHRYPLAADAVDWDILCYIISNIACVPVDSIQESTRFVEELGFG